MLFFLPAIAALYVSVCWSVGLFVGVNEFQEVFKALKVHVMVMFNDFLAVIEALYLAMLVNLSVGQ